MASTEHPQIKLKRLKERLEKYGLKIKLFVGGMLARVTDGPYDFWADPDELRIYLEQTPEAEWNARDMPLSEEGPPFTVLERFADDKKVPGRYFRRADEPSCWTQIRYKLLPGGCWLYLEKNQSPIFFTPSQAEQYGFTSDNLQEIP